MSHLTTDILGLVVVLSQGLPVAAELLLGVREITSELRNWIVNSPKEGLL